MYICMYDGFVEFLFICMSETINFKQQIYMFIYMSYIYVYIYIYIYIYSKELKQ